MSDQATTRLAEIRSRAEAFDTASMGNGVGAAYDSAADVPFLLSLVEAARALHKPERRYIDSTGQGETSFEFAKDTAEFYEIPVDHVSFFEVCAHCGRIERGDEGGRDYRESLWPCADAKALGVSGDH